MNNKTHFYKFISVSIAVIFFLSSSSSLFAASVTNDFGPSGDETSITTTGSGNGTFTVTVGNNNPVIYTPGTSLNSLVNTSGLGSYINDNMVVQTDWGEIATNVGIAIVVTYVGNCLFNAVGGFFSGGTSGWSSGDRWNWSNAFSGSWNGLSTAATSPLTVNGSADLVNTALKTQTICTYLGQAAQHHDWDDSTTYIVQAAAGSLVSFGYGGAQQLYGGPTTSSVWALTGATLLELGAPVLGAWTVTSLVDDEDIANNDIPLETLALGWAVQGFTSGLASGLTQYGSVNNQQNYYQNSDGKWYDNADFSGKGQTMDQLNTIYDSRVQGVGNNGSGAVVTAYEPGTFNWGQFGYNMGINPLFEAVKYAAGRYLNYSAVSGTEDYLEDEYGWDTTDWRSCLISGIVDYSTKRLWAATSNQLNLDYTPLNPNQEAALISRNTQRELQARLRNLSNIDDLVNTLVTDGGLSWSQAENIINALKLEYILGERESAYNSFNSYVSDLFEQAGIDINNLSSTDMIALVELSDKGGLLNANDDSSLSADSIENSDLRNLLNSTDSKDISLRNNLLQAINIANKEFQAAFSNYMNYIRDGGYPLVGHESEDPQIAQFSHALCYVFGFDLNGTVSGTDAATFLSEYGDLMKLGQQEVNAYNARNGGNNPVIFQYAGIETATPENFMVGYTNTLELLQKNTSYSDYMRALDSSGWGLFVSDLKDALTSSFWDGIAQGTVNHIKNYYVNHKWLKLDRYDSTIDSYQNIFDSLSSNPDGTVDTSLISNLTTNQQTALNTYNETTVNLTDQQRQTIIDAARDGDTSFSDLSSDIQNAQGAEQYYNALVIVYGKLTSTRNKRAQLNQDTQTLQFAASYSLNTVSSIVRGIGMYFGWDHSGGTYLSAKKSAVALWDANNEIILNQQQYNRDLEQVNSLADRYGITPTSIDSMTDGTHQTGYLVQLNTDVYSKPSLWTSIQRSYTQSTMQALKNGLSLNSLSNPYNTGFLDRVTYNLTLNDYVRGAWYGSSIISGALTKATYETAGSNISTMRAISPFLADLFGVKYMRLVRVTNFPSANQWQFMTQEYRLPNVMSQKLFFMNSVSARPRTAGTVSFNDYVNNLNTNKFEDTSHTTWEY